MPNRSTDSWGGVLCCAYSGNATSAAIAKSPRLETDEKCPPIVSPQPREGNALAGLCTRYAHVGQNAPRSITLFLPDGNIAAADRLCGITGSLERARRTQS